MATDRAKAIRANNACERIVLQLDALGVMINLPRLHKDREMLRVIQLERIADALEKAVAYESDCAKAIDLAQNGATKAAIVAVLLGEDASV